MLCGHEETKMKIKIITLRMPSLAEQKECIQLLKNFFLNLFICLHWVFVEAHEIFKNWLINDLLWGTLGLCCCVQVFSNYSLWGPTLSLWSMGFSLWWLLSLLKPQALGFP